jgi:hypothetical protein
MPLTWPRAPPNIDPAGSAISSCVQHPPWAFQQLGRPIGNPPYHLNGPPWLAGLGLRRWYTYLVYPQQSSWGSAGWFLGGAVFVSSTSTTFRPDGMAHRSLDGGRAMMGSCRVVAPSNAVATSMAGWWEASPRANTPKMGWQKRWWWPLKFAHKALSSDCTRESTMRHKVLSDPLAFCTSLVVLWHLFWWLRFCMIVGRPFDSLCWINRLYTSLGWLPHFKRKNSFMDTSEYILGCRSSGFFAVANLPHLGTLFSVLLRERQHPDAAASRAWWVSVAPPPGWTAPTIVVEVHYDRQSPPTGSTRTGSGSRCRRSRKHTNNSRQNLHSGRPATATRIESPGMARRACSS